MAGRRLGPWRLLALVAVAVAATVAVPAAGAHGHKPKPPQGQRFGVDFSLGNGEFDSHLIYTSDSGCFTKTTEEDAFSFDALYFLWLPKGRGAPSLTLVDHEPESWSWDYTIEEAGCGSEAEAAGEGTEHCTSNGGFAVEPPSGDGPQVALRGKSLRLDLEVTSGVLIGKVNGPERCGGKLGSSLFYPASALYLPQMLSATVSVPRAALAKAPKRRPGGKGEQDLWTERGIGLALADRPPLDCSAEASETCDQHVKWQGRVRIFRMK